MTIQTDFPLTSLDFCAPAAQQTPPFANTQKAVAALSATVAAIVLLSSTWVQASVPASKLPITAQQRTQAVQTAQAGVPLSDLVPNAPSSYVVKRGDTLWDISKLFLKSPWRWPQLWGMNLEEIKNPHLIYPGQELFLDISNGRARLRMGKGANEPLRISPSIRSSKLTDQGIPTLKMHLIEPFLTEPIILDADTLHQAPRVVAANDERVLISKGDRMYARSSTGNQLIVRQGFGERNQYRIFRNTTELKDPSTGEILGYEAQYVGRANMARSEGTAPRPQGDNQAKETSWSNLFSERKTTDIIPATFDVTHSKEEIRAGDRIVAEPPLEILNYVPQAAPQGIQARIVSVYGGTAINAGNHYVVTINKGVRDGITRGQIFAVSNDGQRILDKTAKDWEEIKLPSERAGLLMVFRPFNRVSYALVVQANGPLHVGDWLSAPPQNEQ